MLANGAMVLGSNSQCQMTDSVEGHHHHHQLEKWKNAQQMTKHKTMKNEKKNSEYFNLQRMRRRYVDVQMIFAAADLRNEKRAS